MRMVLVVLGVVAFLVFDDFPVVLALVAPVAAL
jgi:hypothetical protein